MALADEVSEHKIIKLKNSCINDPIYLSWLNRFGGTSYWLFGKLNNYITKTKEVGYFERYVSDLETTQGNDGIISKTNEKTITVGAFVEESDMDGLRSLFESPKVKMLTNPTTWTTEGAKWHDVRIDTGSFIYKRTNKQNFEIEMDIILPKQYVISE